MPDAGRESDCAKIPVPPDVTKEQYDAADKAANALREEGPFQPYIRGANAARESRIQDEIYGPLDRQRRAHADAAARRGSCYLSEDADLWRKR